jgi:S1-C subfamily serine protease
MKIKSVLALRFLVLFLFLLILIVLFVGCQYQTTTSSDGKEYIVIGNLDVAEQLTNEGEINSYFNQEEINSDTIKQLKEHVVLIKYQVRYNILNKEYKKEVTGSGIIFSENEGKTQILTNRHVIDCKVTRTCCLLDECYPIINEEIIVRTPDGGWHSVEIVAHAPHELDLSMVEIDAVGHKIPNGGDILKEGEMVTAVGFPAYASGVVEVATYTGKLDGIKNVLSLDGFEFQSLESTAYTFFGSSGGGLFDMADNLVGINTWLNFQSKESIAIRLSSIDSTFSNFTACEKGTYLDGEKCVSYDDSIELLEECTEACICGSDSEYYQKICKESCEYTKYVGGEKDLLNLIETNKQSCENVE